MTERNRIPGYRPKLFDCDATAREYFNFSHNPNNPTLLFVVVVSHLLLLSLLLFLQLDISTSLGSR